MKVNREAAAEIDLQRQEMIRLLAVTRNQVDKVFISPEPLWTHAATLALANSKLNEINSILEIN